MDKTSDHYRSIANPVREILLKDRGSKFLGYAFPVSSEESIKQELQKLQNEHPQANHHCFAWRLGKNYEHYRANDDGEPSNSAGMPIYGQIQAFGLTEILVVVVRYFGGTKLGVGGLITAYKSTAAESLKQAKIVCKTIKQHVEIIYDYSNTSKVKAMLHQEKPEVIEEDFGAKCRIVLGVPKSKKVTFLNRFNAWKGTKVTLLD